jgi:hypothetical protein
LSASASEPLGRSQGGARRRIKTISRPTCDAALAGPAAGLTAFTAVWSDYQIRIGKDSSHRDNLSRAGWSWGCVSAIDSNGRTFFVADAHRDDGKRFVVRADENLTAFVELESAMRSRLIVLTQSRLSWQS